MYCSALYLALSVEFLNFFDCVGGVGAARLDMVVVVLCFHAMIIVEVTCTLQQCLGSGSQPGRFALHNNVPFPPENFI